MTTETATDTGTATPDAGTTQLTAAADTAAVTDTTAKPAGQEGATNAQTEPKDQAGADGTKAGDDAPPVYDFKAPEGVELDAAAVDEFKALATDVKLAPEAAQKVVDLYAKLEAKRAEDFAHRVQEWGEQTKADKEFGGEKLAENLAVAKQAVEKFATPEFKSLLDSTGMGNHPEVVRMFVKIGKAISEDSIVRGAPNNGAPTDHASILYGKN